MPPYSDFEFLFDLSEDPGEQRDRSEQEPERAGRLRALLREEMARFAGKGVQEVEGRELSDAVGERLRALGYVE